jgi:DNA-binding NtrC family response regulator
MTEARPIRVLIADDEKNLTRVLGKELGRRGHRVAVAESGAQAVDRLRQEPADVLLLDINMPDMDGIEVLRRLQDAADRPEVIMMTAYATVPTAIEAMKLGAYDYLTKPTKIEKLDLLIRKAAEKRGLAQQNEALKRQLERERGGSSLITQSPRLQEAVRIIALAAPTDSTVLIQGESGTGKELAAQAVHAQSLRRDGPFVPLHCAALPRETLESELFGHERGAFTGAHAPKKGLYEEADGGTLFLDEVGEIPPEMQVKLLRVLETGTFYHLGATKPRRADVRIVAATNRDLAREVREGRFREDLYYRLNTIVVTLPPLRERPEDILALARHFLEAYSNLGRKTLSPRAEASLQRYGWPGNVRELQHAIQRSLILSPRDVIEPEDLPMDVQVGAPGAPAPPPPGGAGTHPQGSPGPPAPPGAPFSLEELEKQHILAVLAQVNGHRGKAAALLGIDPKTLYRKLQGYGLDTTPGGGSREPVAGN